MGALALQPRTAKTAPRANSAPRRSAPARRPAGYTADREKIGQINALSTTNGAYLWAASSGAASFDGEFNALSLWNGSTGVWATNYGFGGNPDSVAARTLPGTGEVELYVDPSMTGTGTTALGLNPYSESGGVLDLHAAPTPAADLSSIWGYKFTSGMISTRSTFTQTYGYFEAGMKLPAGTGNWPAFWLYAVNANSELDVMEEQNGSNTITGTAHNNGSGTAATGVTNTIPNLTAGFHKFGVLWTPTTITWYVDEVSIGSVPTPSNLNSPMYMIANLALNSSTPANYAGGDLQIEYVHAYTLANAPVFTSNQNLTASANGLNQLATSGGSTLSYDARGNLTSDGVNTYAYDTLNQLSTFNTSTTLNYDSRHRLTSISANGATATQFVYAGDQLAAEVQVTGSTPTLVGRYVPGVGEDRPLTMYTGATMASPYELLEDHAGSIVAANSASGGSLYINSYSDYGVRGASNFGRYQYTGQVWLPEVGLYNYKGRLYSATLGRFMQTDPVGYGDGPNWYAYVHGDPVNETDPSGLDGSDCTSAGVCDAGTVNGAPPAAGSPAGGGSGGGSAPEPGSGRGINVVQEVVVTSHRLHNLIIALSQIPVPQIVCCATLTIKIQAVYSPSPSEIKINFPWLVFSRPGGAWPGDKGSAEWGRKNGMTGKEGTRRFHGIKQGDGGRGKDDYSVDPKTGDVYDPNGDYVGNLNDPH